MRARKRILHKQLQWKGSYNKALSWTGYGNFKWVIYIQTQPPPYWKLNCFCVSDGTVTSRVSKLWNRDLVFRTELHAGHLPHHSVRYTCTFYLFGVRTEAAYTDYLRAGRPGSDSKKRQTVSASPIRPHRLSLSQLHVLWIPGKKQPKRQTNYSLPSTGFIIWPTISRSRDRSVEIIMRYRLEGWGSIPGMKKGFISTASTPAVGPPTLLSNGHWKLFSWG